MQMRNLLALKLADQRIDDRECHVIAERGQRINFRHRLREFSGVSLETNRVVHRTGREAVKIAAHASGIVIQQWGDIDDLRNLFREEFGHERFSADVVALLLKLEIAVNELSEK